MWRDIEHGKGRGGSVVMTASLAGYLASAGVPLYSAAKRGIVGLMRAPRNDLATVDIAISVVAPGITVTPILSQERIDIKAGGIDERAAGMQKLGVPINKAETIALAVAHLIHKRMASNGQGILIQANQMAEIEGGIAKARSQWMSEEMLKLFRGGRNAPPFLNKLRCLSRMRREGKTRMSALWVLTFAYSTFELLSQALAYALSLASR
jgi:hypothetical protein